MNYPIQYNKVKHSFPWWLTLVTHSMHRQLLAMTLVSTDTGYIINTARSPGTAPMLFMSHNSHPTVLNNTSCQRLTPLAHIYILSAILQRLGRRQAHREFRCFEVAFGESYFPSPASGLPSDYYSLLATLFPVSEGSFRIYYHFLCMKSGSPPESKKCI